MPPTPPKKPSPSATSSSTTSPKEPAPGSQPVWDENVLACRNTYVLLVGLKQLKEPFSAAGDLTMKNLAFWNATSSDTDRQLVAAGLGTQIDKFYIKVLLARYEEGYDFHSAIEDLKATLASAEKTLRQLAALVDAIYHFRGE